MDYDQPRPVIPTHVEETQNGVRAVVDSGWEHVVSASRTLTPEGDTLVDRTESVLDGEHVITLHANTSNMEVYVARAPGNPATELCTSIILRVHGDKAVFEMEDTQRN